ncbi:MAG: hypothetical protein CL578_18530 [Alteromonadaceae bacterium]|jgi:restriction endonuclease S subunit|uniref:restriction endonuclease subunit S n=1 Tax=unclassified Methylophaga TaxID=2629249 RepID=UPI000C48FCCD|nr:MULTISPECIES: restriction endonuclease subunit S [unclassified Methylophaga]MAP25505.1 hypothetical protein [Methylophaga sp.]MBN27025.1 hypothetical protein [Alteromonadaceae bacterium]|tara:strand:+ start:39858 stop:40568 length:711 start_codon:yes stop_codon:yes gene_type:complete
MNEKNLEELGEITSGRGFKEGVKVEKDGISVVSMADVGNEVDKIHWENVKKANIPLRTHKLLQNNDILFLAKGKQNKAIAIDGLKDKAVATHQFFVIHPKKEIDSHFVAKGLNGEYAQNYFVQNARGETKRHITKTDLGNLKVFVPPVEQQRMLVQIMDGLEDRMRHIQFCRSQLLKAFDLVFEGKLDGSEQILTQLMSVDNNEFIIQTEQLYALLKLMKLESADKAENKRNSNRI